VSLGGAGLRLCRLVEVRFSGEECSLYRTWALDANGGTGRVMINDQSEKCSLRRSLVSNIATSQQNSSKRKERNDSCASSVR